MTNGAPLSGGIDNGAMRSSRTRRTQWFLFLVMSAVWGASYFFVNLGLRSFDPFTLVALRMGIAGLTLAGVHAVSRIPWPRDRRTYARLAVLSVINVTLPFTILAVAQQHVSATLTSILSSTTPLFVFVIAAVMLGDERFNLPKFCGSLIAFGGVVYLFLGMATTVSESSWVGEAAVLLSSSLFAFGNVSSRRLLIGITPLTATLLQSTFGFVVGAILAFAFGHPLETHLEFIPVVAVIWLGTAGTAATYVLWFYFLRKWGSRRTSINVYLQPFVGVMLGIVVLGDRFDSRVLVAAVIILTGVMAFGWFGRPKAVPLT